MNSVDVERTVMFCARRLEVGVDDLSQCTDHYGGWYYDNPSAPTRVIACPQTCTTIQADDAARIDVLFGCAREEPPIR